MPNTFVLPVKVTKCPCGAKSCSTHQLSVGQWYQGAGFSEEQALEIAGILNASEKITPDGAATVYTETEIHNFGQRLLALTPGGSEYFRGSSKGGYKISLEAVVSFLERHHNWRICSMKKERELISQVEELQERIRKSIMRQLP